MRTWGLVVSVMVVVILLAGAGCGGAPSELCGNFRLDDGEECDTDQVISCQDLGYEVSGFTLCSPVCAWAREACGDTSACGDNVREGREECDGDDLGGATCDSLELPSGTLACTELCKLDTSGCTGSKPVTCGNGTLETGETCDDANTITTDGCTAACEVDPEYTCTGTPSVCTPKCGNGTLDQGEQCDGTNLGGGTCPFGGTLGCTAACTHDTSACTPCGNGVIDSGEQCDGIELGGNTCSSVGDFTAGQLSCFQCTFDTSTCTTCGDGVAEGTEICDGTDLAGATCASRGYVGGTLRCASDCSGYVETQCHRCGDGVVQIGFENCDGTNLNGQTTCDGLPAEEPFLFDAGPVTCGPNCFFDTSQCTRCGDHVAEGAEECDLVDLRGQTCASLGFMSGTLSCSFSCQFDLSSCSNAVCGNGLVEPGEGCDDGNTTTVEDGCRNCRVSSGYECTGEPSQCTKVCGDGVLQASETCDDGNAESTDGCAANCTVEPGFTCAGVGPGSCTTPCGDGIARGPEDCDGTAGCSATCQLLGAIAETEPNDIPVQAMGPFDVATFPDLVFAASILTSTNQAGDLDMWRFTNSSAKTIILRFDTYSPLTGIGSPCSNIDTEIHVFDALGQLVGSNSDRVLFADRCAGMDIPVPPGGTRFVRVHEFLNDDLITRYLVRAIAPNCGDGTVGAGEECEPPNTASCTDTCQRQIVCGDGFVDGTEKCDDGNTVSGDSCSATCTIEETPESEPNDDGSTVRIATNNFDAAAADGPFSGPTFVRGSISPSGDDDVVAIFNPSLAPVLVQVDVWNTGLSSGVPCGASPDLALAIRDATGLLLFENADRDGNADRCPGLSFLLGPGETVYAHLTAAGDTGFVGAYHLQIRFP